MRYFIIPFILFSTLAYADEKTITLTESELRIFVSAQVGKAQAEQLLGMAKEVTAKINAAFKPDGANEPNVPDDPTLVPVPKN